MSYSPEVYAKIGEIYNRRRRDAIEGLDARIEEANEKIPGMRQIERVLSATGLRAMEAIRAGEGIDAVREENDRLVARREELLVSHGYPADWCDPRYVCPLCQDTGFVDGKYCACMKDALYRAQAELSGLGKLLGAQTFDNFDLKYYEQREEAASVLSRCRDFAENGCARGENLLLIGGTGLGKTHLSTAIADCAMRNGRSVIYESAPSVVENFRREQYRSFSDKTPVTTEKYFDADLLILDDLGCELPGAFTVATVYNLVNTRMLSGRSTLINTNLSASEITERYDRRIVSRLFGNYSVCLLTGEDVRMQKLREKK